MRGKAGKAAKGAKGYRGKAGKGEAKTGGGGAGRSNFEPVNSLAFLCAQKIVGSYQYEGGGECGYTFLVEIWCDDLGYTQCHYEETAVSDRMCS